MVFPELQRKDLIKLSFISLIAFFVPLLAVSETSAKIVIEKKSGFGVIKGIVRDEQGSPISDAIVAVFQTGSSKALKQVRSAVNGSFLAKVLPGKYTVLAVAQGYNAMTVSEVQVNRSTELNYGFKLERSGDGNTLPEKRNDRFIVKNRVRAAVMQRSIYQINEGTVIVDENKNADDAAVAQNTDETITFANSEEREYKRRGQSVVETYFANSSEGGYTGVNFATLQPLNENTEIIFAGQTGTKSFAPQRFEATLKTRLNENHQIRLTGSAIKIGKVGNFDKSFGQVSLQALDEWKVKNGIILVVGFDYSRFVGAGKDSFLSPRFGLQLDVDSKTRFKTAYTTQTEERTWSQAIDFEGSPILFREQYAPQSIAVEEHKPLMNKSRRLEFGIERVLDNNSNLEATAFFDSVTGRGLSLVNTPINTLNTDNFAPFTVSQQGKAQGFRIVYTRRIDKTFSTSAGYAFGNGQKLSSSALANPANIFENGFFQTFVGQLNADLKTGTQVKTIFRLSPQATVFAIDPFAGRLAIFDPSLSILITQPLPTLGLPIRAEAIIDARNLLEYQIGVNGEEGSLKLNSQRRVLRGGISVRF
jgi:hypothetical protein